MKSLSDRIAPNDESNFNGAQLLVALLERYGVDTVFGVPGGAVLPIYDALLNSRIKHVLARHEQGAGFMAQGLARSSGKTQVCLASSGPGASNLLTAVADAKMDSIPLLAITGQVSQHLLGTDAFQEIDTDSLMKPITKYNCMVRSVEELAELIPRAFAIAKSGRPGPVSIDIPKDVQLASANLIEWPETKAPAAGFEIATYSLETILDMLHQAHKPILLSGAGVIKSGASDAMRHFAEHNDLMVAHTLLGLGALPSSHPLSLGMIGMHAAPYTNHLLQECDLLFAIGARFDDRATGDPNKFCPNARIIHADIDAHELGKIIPATLAVLGDAKSLLSELNRMQSGQDKKTRTIWRQRAQQLKQKRPLKQDGVNSFQRPYGLIKRIAQSLSDDAIVTTDVGQHQMWVAQSFPFQWPGQLVTSGGLGTMGFGVPAAIGCALAEPTRTVVCFTGDGSLMMNIQELATIAEHQLNIKIIVFDNGHLGLVRQQQKLFYEENYHANQFQQKTDFVLAANAMGLPGRNLSRTENPMRFLQRALNGKGPILIECPIADDEMVFPMVAPGAANHEMIEA